MLPDDRQSNELTHPLVVVLIAAAIIEFRSASMISNELFSVCLCACRFVRTSVCQSKCTYFEQGLVYFKHFTVNALLLMCLPQLAFLAAKCRLIWLPFLFWEKWVVCCALCTTFSDKLHCATEFRLSIINRNSTVTQ